MIKNFIILILLVFVISSWNTTTPKLWLCFKSKMVHKNRMNHFEIVLATTKKEAEAVFESQNKKPHFDIPNTKKDGFDSYFVIEAEKITHKIK